MRVTQLFDLQNSDRTRDRIKEGIMHDIESIAEEKFKNDKFRKFAIKIKLVPIKYF
jgi:hypothetical protein